jgi:hypothetical protein
MRGYWLRILLGALAVFAVGMIGVTMVRQGKKRVAAVIGSSEPLSIPLPFVPFQLDGNKLGTVERLVVNRETPKKVSSIELQVKLGDSLVAQGLAGCRLAANVESDSTGRRGDVNIQMNRLDERTFFFCATSDSGFEEFGSVELSPGEVRLPLLVPQSLAQHLRSGDWAHDADSSEALQQRAESLADRAEELADSAAEAGERAATIGLARSKLGDSLRAEGKRRADSLRQALGRMADSLKAR